MLFRSGNHMLFVASAGNDGVDVTQDNVTPASFDEDHFSLLTVGDRKSVM